jgi:signal transduction histidine kinase/ligand-binding sensor domain-containing protein
MKFRFILFLSYVGFLSPVYGNSVEFIHKNLNIEQGLPESTVIDIVEDNLGFIWIATPSFLCRYDGADFKIFQKNFDLKLGPDEFRKGKLYIRNNKLWMITKGGKLEYMDLLTEKFYSINSFKNRDVEINGLNCLYFLEENRIYLGTDWSGLYVVDLEFNIINHLTDQGSNGLSSNKINDMFIDNSNQVWLLTNKGINRIKHGIVKQYLKDINFSMGFQIPFVERLGLGTMGKGIIAKEVASENFHPLFYYSKNKEMVENLIVSDLFLIPRGLITDWKTWIGSIGSGLMVESSSSEILEVNLKDSPKDILCIFGTGNGQIWVGTRNHGLYVLQENLGFNIQVNKNLSEVPLKLYETAQKELVIINQEGKLSLFDTDQGILKTEKINFFEVFSEFNDQGLELIPIENKEFLLGYDKKKSELFLFDLVKKNKEEMAIENSHLLTDMLKNFNDLENKKVFLENNLLIFHLPNSGMLIFDPVGQMEEYLEFHEIIHLFYIPELGFLTLSLDGSVGFFDPKKKIIENPPHLKNSIALTSVINDVTYRKDWLWMATAGSGIYLINLKKGTSLHFDTSSGLPSNYIMALEFHDDRTIWASSNNGIFRMNFSKVEEIIKLGNINYFNHKNGLPISEFMPGKSFVDSTGKVYFLGNRGLLLIKTQNFNRSNFSNNIVFTEIKANHKSIHTALAHHYLESIQLEYNENTLEFYFSSLSGTSPENLNYSYLLEGYDKDWINAGNRRYASYTNLSPGSYLFKVKLAHDNPESAKYKMLEIHIDKAYWQTAWFIGALILVFSLILFLLYKTRINYLLKIRSIREEISADLHDDLGARLTTIQLLSAIHKNRFRNHKEFNQVLQQIDSEVLESTEALHDLVGNIKMNGEQMDDFMAKMRRYISETLESADLKYTIKINENISQKVLNINRRKDLFFVIKELINNIRKHANASKVDVDFDIKEDQLLLLVKDNGIGFDIDYNSGRNGLKNLKARVEKNNGILSINSIKNTGTIIKILIPFDSVRRIRSIGNLWN